MTEIPEVVVESVAGAVGEKTLSNSGVVPPQVIAATGFAERRVTECDLFGFSMKAVRALPSLDGVGAVIAATFSNETRFPSLAVRIASACGLAPDTPAFDLQLACSAYPYAVYLAGKTAADFGCRVLVVDADVQSRFARTGDTMAVMSDAATASVVSCAGSSGRKSFFSFFSRYDEALSCGDEIKMDGFRVYSFVAGEVRRFLGGFAEKTKGEFDLFVPHQANMYMVRQLARSLGLEDVLAGAGREFGNTGSSSVALGLARCPAGSRALIAGFGAGLSASAGIVALPENFKAAIV